MSRQRHKLQQMGQGRRGWGVNVNHKWNNGVHKPDAAGDICFPPYIIIRRSTSLSLSQRRPINHSWTEELFSQARRHDNSSVTAQPVSKYSICHSEPKAPFSWFKLCPTLSVGLLPLVFTFTWWRVILVLSLRLHKHVQGREFSSRDIFKGNITSNNTDSTLPQIIQHRICLPDCSHRIEPEF